MSDVQILALLLMATSSAVPVAYFWGRERVLQKVREISRER